MCGNTPRRVRVLDPPSKNVTQTSRLSELDALTAWTARTSAALVFDTDTDGWDHRKFNDVLRRPSNAVVAFTEQGDVFGAFVSVAVTETNRVLPDGGQFAFSLDSRWRCGVPRRWVLRDDRKDAGRDVEIDNPASNVFVAFGSDGHIVFVKGRRTSYVGDPSGTYEGLGDDVLIGEARTHFTTARLVVVRLE